MNNKAQRETALKRLFVKSSFIVMTLSLFSGTAAVARFDWGLSQLVDNIREIGKTDNGIVVVTTHLL